MIDFLIADTHLNHKNIIKYCNRPFASTEEMDEHLLSEINKRVKEGDRLFHLGDFSMGRVDYYLDKIKCKNIILIKGNHDKDNIRHKIKTYDLYELNKNKDKIVLCHYAMAVWNKSHHGAYHFYGHSHSQSEKLLDRLFPQRRSMDVGVDNINRLFGYYGPIKLDDAIDFLKTKSGEDCRGR